MANDAASIRSRYKDTDVFPGPSGPSFGILTVPAEFVDVPLADYRRYSVTAADVGFPDRIMTTAFGIGYEDLWWMVLLVNGFIDPETELQPGRVLLIPPQYAVQAFLSRV